MQNELLAENPATKIRLLGVNSAGSETGNVAMCDGRDIPWLQDTFVDDVWGLWEVRVDDVVVLDEEGKTAFVYNTADKNLAVSANYEELKSLLKVAAGE